MYRVLLAIDRQQGRDTSVPTGAVPMLKDCQKTSVEIIVWYIVHK